MKMVYQNTKSKTKLMKRKLTLVDGYYYVNFLNDDGSVFFHRFLFKDGDLVNCINPTTMSDKYSLSTNKEYIIENVIIRLNNLLVKIKNDSGELCEYSSDRFVLSKRGVILRERKRKINKLWKLNV